MNRVLKATVIIAFCFPRPDICFAQKDPLYIDKDGKVGIGTLKPRALFNIQTGDIDPGNTAIGKALFISGLFGSGQIRDGGIEFRHDNLTQGIGFGFNTIYATGVNENQQLNLISKGTQPITLNAYGDSKGNVGIGTNDPKVKLEVIGTGGGTVDLSVNGRIRSNNTDGGLWIADKSFVGGYGTNRLGLYNGGWRLFVVPSGEVCIGGDATRTPGATLDVAGTIREQTMFVDNGVIQRSGERITATHDLGLYSRQHPYNIRVVTNKASVMFFTKTDVDYGGSEDQTSMIIKPDGRVGIGVGSPAAMLHVNGTVGYGARNYAYYNAGANHNTTNGGRNLSILTSGDIGSGYEFVAYSDMRIKKDFKLSDPLSDLETLKKLKVTDYRYIDGLNYGDEYKKGFLAQEVEKVFPQAVKKSTDFVPDIFAIPSKVTIADSVVTVTMGKPHHLATGDIVKIYADKQQEERMVNVADERSFTFHASPGDSTDLFVFGKKVNDFRLVDYDRLFTLNVGATQQLAKEVEQLKAENGKLKDKYDELANKLILLEAKVDEGATIKTKPRPATHKEERNTTARN